MMIWEKLRLSLLMITFSSVLLVLGQVIVLPKQYKSTLESFVFPETVPLPEWQLQSHSSLPQNIQNSDELIAQKRYQYIQKNLPLDIEMRYVTTGDVDKLLKKYTQISSSTIVRNQANIGYYGLGFYQHKAYLSACINLQGNSTFTVQQFNQNQQPSDQELKNILPWLLGKQELKKQKRCLWAHLSIPLKNSSPEAAYQVLEKTWFSWYQYWYSRLQKT